ncbi:GNAT family N-acetyltransferase [Streptomyces sp. PmtG]
MGFHGAPDDEGWAEIGYDLSPTARGNGYATEALRTLTSWALRLPDVTGLRAVVDEGNTASEALLRRANYTRSADREGQRTYTLSAHPGERSSPSGV